MKNILTLIWLCVCMINANAQNDTIVVKHTAYTSVFSNSGHIPVLVWYSLTGEQLSCNKAIKRTNDFKADPLVPGTSLNKDYEASGYDQGHNMSAEDNCCDKTEMHECFYFTNMLPQAPGLNRGIWKSLENQERQWAKDSEQVIVFIGSFGIDKKIGPDSVIVPAYCWKVIYIPKHEEWYEFIFPNQSCEGTFEQYSSFTKEQQEWEEYLIHKFTDY